MHLLPTIGVNFEDKGSGVAKDGMSDMLLEVENIGESLGDGGNGVVR